MSTEPKVVIVVLNYNGEKCLHQTLESLQSLDYREKEVVVVDNASQDHSFDLAKKNFPQFHFISLPKNGGFAYGMNAGMRFALEQKADFIWLFNYDALASRESLRILVRNAETLGDRALFSPTIFNNKKIWFEGGRINYWKMRVEHLRQKRDQEKAFKTQFLTGCALFLPIRAIKEIGFLDEDFFLYYEDADYSKRALNKGFDLYVVPEAKVLHSEESVHNPQKVYHLVFSGLLFFSKHPKGIFSFYQAIYGILRRQKNRLDLFMGKPLAEEVSRAHSEFYAKKSPLFLNHLRKL
ncbi:MAG: glycosyltransferase family 2 protein [Candidatus Moranbacteria bacterium]|nr:glycosyltransferase family 2 protein [Candidatus Moranbacteria bacterium]